MQIRVLGPFEVRGDDGGLVDVPGARLRGLLVALALRTGSAVPKATLVDWIWGEQPPADASNALQRLVSRLRKVLPDGAIEGHTDGYRLTAAADDVDALRFERLAGAGRVSEALALWRGPAMQDVGLVDSGAFDAVAARLDGMRLAALEEHFEAATAHGGGAELVGELTDLVAAYPGRERLVAALMRALAAAGRDSEALLVFQRAKEALAEELGVDPGPELSALHVALLRGEFQARPRPRATNLRAELTTFIGRDADVAAVRELVAGHRLTTLTGPGGAGKTRLATETARALLSLVAEVESAAQPLAPTTPAKSSRSYGQRPLERGLEASGVLTDGVWLVELAPLGPGGDVAQAALSGLGLRDALLGASPDADAEDRFVAAVRDREVLLILDNCEHVIEAAAGFAHRVLGACGRLRILATSREPLGIIGEALWPVEPLGLPDGHAGPAEIEASPAVRLLLDRAGAVRQDLTADAATLATMARVCRALDGMPLAIELAAARLRTMSVEQLAHRLDDRFRILTGGSRTALPRHRTLRAMVDWSWELLSPDERMVLRRLSVFSGGASLEGAERVCAAGGADLELLTALAEKSLVVVAGGDAPRYRLLGTIKEYAAQRLAEAGEAESARRAHLGWCVELAEAADPHLRRAEQLQWLAVLEAEHDNLAAAMRAAIAAGEAHEAMRLGAGAGFYWWLAGHKAEGIELLAAAIRLPGAVPDLVRARALAFMGMFASGGRNDERHAADYIREAFALGGRDGARDPLLAFIGPLERMLHGADQAVAAFEALLVADDPWTRALARLQLGKMRIVLGHGGRDADAFLEQALGEFRAIGERYGIQFALTELADRVATRGEFATACALFEEAIAVSTELGSAEDIIRTRARLAPLYRLAGDEAAAAATIAEAERLAERVTWPDALADLALAKAGLAACAGDGDGDRAEARRQIAAAMVLLGPEADLPGNRSVVHDLLGYLTDDLDKARVHRAAAVAAAAETGYLATVAQVLVGVADLALRLDEPEQAARLLGAAAAVRGLPDRSHPRVAGLERRARGRLGDQRYAEAAREGAAGDWQELARVTLAG